MKRIKDLEFDGIKFVLKELTQGDIISISKDSKETNIKGQPFTDENKFNLLFVNASMKSWDFKDDKGEPLAVNVENTQKLPVHIFKELLDEAGRLNMTDKEKDFLASRML